MAIRINAVAGQFYDASPGNCLEAINLMRPPALPPGVRIEDLPEKIVAGIVPHAGWVFSGELALAVFDTIQKRQSVDTFIIFGAVHSVRTPKALLYDHGQWSSPLGTIDVDENLSESLYNACPQLIKKDCAGHSREHSIEVQIPFIQHLFKNASIVPIMVPPIDGADDIGRAAARVIQRSDKNIICIASTDLTHYGPSYSYSPMGIGPEALKWAKETNDQFFINLAVTMQADKLVESARLYGSACGAGAVAAAVAAASELGANKGIVTGHTTSAEIMRERFNQASEDSVGYAGIVF
ncbi:MAG: AmmeMemoRadiSam system protein B [Phycisphaerae bacterium]|nr:AmmeMemoRadiSam system protein B [Phycisphaerae bacterium]